MTEKSLDLIKRQKAEIERLKTEKDNLIRTYAECQAEAVKEFVKKFEKKIKNVQFTLGQAFEIQSALKETKKEMVGDADGCEKM